MAANQATGTPDDRRLSTNANDLTSSAELSAVVDELLNSLSNKFAGVSSEIFAKMDEMSRRLDKLETTLQSSSSDGKDGKPNPSIG